MLLIWHYSVVIVLLFGCVGLLLCQSAVIYVDCYIILLLCSSGVDLKKLFVINLLTLFCKLDLFIKMI